MTQSVFESNFGAQTSANPRTNRQTPQFPQSTFHDFSFRSAKEGSLFEVYLVEATKSFLQSPMKCCQGCTQDGAGTQTWSNPYILTPLAGTTCLHHQSASSVHHGFEHYPPDHQQSDLTPTSPPAEDGMGGCDQPGSKLLARIELRHSSHRISKILSLIQLSPNPNSFHPSTEPFANSTGRCEVPLKCRIV